mmetsp:Transcript_17304/g.46928  ORF Transcript_17304/g.46928 Transcript_17304/m.46928 type:complete len:261 (+) Transcript_17304:1962-2744(+)
MLGKALKLLTCHSLQQCRLSNSVLSNETISAAIGQLELGIFQKSRTAWRPQSDFFHMNILRGAARVRGQHHSGELRHLHLRRWLYVLLGKGDQGFQCLSFLSSLRMTSAFPYIVMEGLLGTIPPYIPEPGRLFRRDGGAQVDGSVQHGYTVGLGLLLAWFLFNPSEYLLQASLDLVTQGVSSVIIIYTVQACRQEVGDNLIPQRPKWTTILLGDDGSDILQYRLVDSRQFQLDHLPDLISVRRRHAGLQNSSAKSPKKKP